MVILYISLKIVVLLLLAAMLGITIWGISGQVVQFVKKLNIKLPPIILKKDDYLLILGIIKSSLFKK